MPRARVCTPPASIWPGSEAEIAGFRPSWYAQFDKTESTPEVQQARIDDAVALLRLPADQRPHFITIYYSEPDHEGHEFGPDAPETRAAERKVDGLIGKLKAALDSTHLPIDLVVVSDHGMVHEEGDWVTLDQFADLTGFDTAGPLLYGKTEEDRERVYNQLKKSFAAIRCLPPEERARRPQLQPEPPRRRSGGHRYRPLSDPGPRFPGRLARTRRLSRACTGSTPTKCRR